MYYVYRYQVFIDGKPTTLFRNDADERFLEILTLEGSCTRYAPGTLNRTTRVKPRNVLAVPAMYWPPRRTMELSGYDVYYRDVAGFLKALALIPWTVDLSTLNLSDYPELFI